MLSGNTGDCDDDLEESAFTVGPMTNDPELLEQFHGNLEDADASATQVYAAASRSFQEARELLSRVKSVRGYFLVVGIQPSTDRTPAKSRGKSKKGKKKGQTSSHKGGKFPNLGTPGVLPKPPMSKKRQTETGTTRGPHHAPRLRPDQCMLSRQVGHRASECPNKRKTTAFSPGKRAFGTYALGCAVFDAMCHGATVKETEEDQDENDTEDFATLSIKSLEGFAILDGGATKTDSGFMSAQPVADQHKDTTIETTDVGFTFAGGETEAPSTKIWVPHAEFPQGISVNVVPNESTPFLTGLDVLREYGVVIDYHHNRVHSHIMKSYLPCAILPTGHLAQEMMPSKRE